MQMSLLEARDYKVVKANSIIQNSRFDLTTQEQKIILYLISKIKPEDIDFKNYTFEISEYCRVCGIDYDSGKNYTDIKRSLKSLRDKSVWVTLENGNERTLAWIDRAEINKRQGSVIVKIDELLKPFLLQLRTLFTEYGIYNILAMKSKYSVRIYELLKSYEYRKEPIEMDIDVLKKRVSAETYTRFPDFKRYVLDIAMREINEFSDIKASYEAKSTPGGGRRLSTIVFHAEFKRDVTERSMAYANIERRLNPKALPGQISLATPFELRDGNA